MNRRFLLLVLGTTVGIEKDLNFIADGETGVNFVDGKGMFICTFYSPFSATEIHEKMSHRPAIMVFDITENENYAVNLPSKYYMGIFPEVQNTMEVIQEKWETPPTKRSMVKEQLEKEVVTEVTEEYSSIDDILDKLSRNNYDRSCLTENELTILSKG